MFIEGIEFNNFRNYEKLNLKLKNGINLFYGDNAQGKTNLIEGIYFSALAKSFKYMTDMGYIKFGEKCSYIKTKYISSGKHNENYVYLSKDKGKLLKINDVPVKKRIDFIGNLNVILFSPQEIGTVKEGPYYRRRYMDICAGQLRKKYLSALSGYNRTLQQKNKLLKEDNPEPMIDIWNEKLAEYGSIILWFRISLIKRIKEIIKEIFYEISEGKEEIKIKYLKSFDFDEEYDIDRIKKEFINELEKKKSEEIREKISLTGPHRDDIIFFINGKNAKIYGSQGQQKSIILALKLVQAELFFRQTGEYPVLLLDDITSEFDDKRKNYLFEKIKDKQVIITGTEKNIVSSNAESMIFRVEKGIITEE